MEKNLSSFPFPKKLRYIVKDSNGQENNSIFGKEIICGIGI